MSPHVGQGMQVYGSALAMRLACSAQAAIDLAKKMQYSAVGDSIVALHRIGNASVIKIVDVK